VLAAVAQYGLVLQYASETLRADRGVVLAAVAQEGRALKWASEPLRADRGVVLAAVAQRGRVLRYASVLLRNDPEVLLAAVAAKKTPMLELIPELIEPLSESIRAALESAKEALDAFEDSAGDDTAVVAECDRIRALEEAIDKAILRLIDAPADQIDDTKRQGYLARLNGLNAYLGDYDNNACVRLQLRRYQPNKRQRIEAALATALATARRAGGA